VLDNDHIKYHHVVYDFDNNLVDYNKYGYQLQHHVVYELLQHHVAFVVIDHLIHQHNHHYHAGAHDGAQCIADDSTDSSTVVCPVGNPDDRAVGGPFSAPDDGTVSTPYEQPDGNCNRLLW
jgi:hypothetical protein